MILLTLRFTIILYVTKVVGYREDAKKSRCKSEKCERGVRRYKSDSSTLLIASCCGIEIMSNTVKLDNMSMTSLDAELLMLHRHHFISNYWKFLNINWKIVHNIKKMIFFYLMDCMIGLIEYFWVLHNYAFDKSDDELKNDDMWNLWW